MPWFQRRRAVAEQEQHRVWRQARVKSDIRVFISKMSEVEVIDSFNAVERQLLAEIQVHFTATYSHLLYTLKFEFIKGKNSEIPEFI